MARADHPARHGLDSAWNPPSGRSPTRLRRNRGWETPPVSGLLGRNGGRPAAIGAVRTGGEARGEGPLEPSEVTGMRGDDERVEKLLLLASGDRATAVAPPP